MVEEAGRGGGGERGRQGDRQTIEGGKGGGKEAQKSDERQG